MGFLDKVKETASVVGVKVKETGTSLGDKSKLVIEKQKLKSAISKENTNINKKYAEIGSKYVEIFGDTPAEEFVTLIDEIKTSQDTITKLKNQLTELDDFVICSCGAKVPKGVAFCSNCGSAVVNVEPTTSSKVDLEKKEVEVIDVTPTDTETQNND